jgi:hypothetical protein
LAGSQKCRRSNSGEGERCCCSSDFEKRRESANEVADWQPDRNKSTRGVCVYSTTTNESNSRDKSVPISFTGIHAGSMPLAASIDRSLARRRLHRLAIQLIINTALPFRSLPMIHRFRKSHNRDKTRTRARARLGSRRSGKTERAARFSLIPPAQTR